MTTVKELRHHFDTTPEGQQATKERAAGRIVIDDFDESLQGLIDKGLAVRVGNEVEITPKGIRFFEEETLRRKQ